MKKIGFLHVVDVFMWLLGLAISVGYYWQHRGTPVGLIGFVILAAFLILGVIFKVVKFMARIIIPLLLLALGYFLFFYHK